MTDSEVKILIVHDINTSNLQILYTKLIEINDPYDYMIICSPVENIESVATQFGTICKKVIYLQDDLRDCDEDVAGAGYVNINGKKHMLNESLYIAGYDEFSTNLKDVNNVLDDIIDDDMLEDQQMIREQFNINTAENTTEMISNLLSDTRIGINDQIHHLNGIFIFRYKYTHSLNRFLFYPEICNSETVKFLIVPSDSEESSRLPRNHGNFTTLVPKSFNMTRKYYTAIIKLGYTELSIAEIVENFI